MLVNKKVLITGGSRGIGLEIARAFLKENADVVITGRNLESNPFFNNPNIEFIEVDFNDNDSVKKFLFQLKSLDRLDILVNNAGINIVSEFTETKEEDFQKIMQVNMLVQYDIHKVAFKLMQKNGGGKIINISSIWGVVSKSGRSLYSISKTAILGLTRSLSIEAAKYNILINSVSPGFTETELTRKTNTTEDLMEIEKLIPLKRLAQPEEVANLVVFLGSSKNTYITGQNIIIDGGFTIQ